MWKRFHLLLLAMELENRACEMKDVHSLSELKGAKKQVFQVQYYEKVYFSSMKPFKISDLSNYKVIIV